MANSTIEHISLKIISQRAGFLGRKQETQEQICLKAPGGHIYLTEHTLTQGGDSWKLFKSRLRASAQEHGIPFEDLRK